MKKYTLPTIKNVEDLRSYIFKLPANMPIKFKDKFASVGMNDLIESVTKGKELVFNLKSHIHKNMVTAGGRVSTEKKAAAARENGKKGGKPRQL